jgi:hypothetical protein
VAAALDGSGGRHGSRQRGQKLLSLPLPVATRPCRRCWTGAP